MYTGKIAIRFIDAIQKEFIELTVIGTFKLNKNWYVGCGGKQYYSKDIDLIPDNSPFGVFADLRVGSFKLSLCWDGLEQSIVATDESEKKHIQIGEFRISAYRSMPGYGSMEKAIAACKTKVEEYFSNREPIKKWWKFW